ncbi:Farnesyl pyrophosphate synthase 1, partial [Bienertia sinuspersici]
MANCSKKSYFNPTSLELHYMLHYLIISYTLLEDGKELSDDKFFLGSILGWCIEWLQAYLMVLDDIMDNSHTRRGQPYWFRVPKIGMIAINDGIILRNHIRRILKHHFRDKKYYVDLLDLFNEVEFQTTSGQMIDLITTIEGEKDLSNYSLDLLVTETNFSLTTSSNINFYLPYNFKLNLILFFFVQCSHRRIVQFKASYYSFYLP